MVVAGEEERNMVVEVKLRLCLFWSTFMAEDSVSLIWENTMVAY